MPVTDRLNGLLSSVAIKAPCLVATTANITLDGEQTIDGVAVVSGDRVLVWNQTDSTTNGIYVSDTGTWARDVDFKGTNQVVQGTIVAVMQGAQYGATIFQQTAADPVIGSTAITFAVSGAAALALASTYMRGTIFPLTTAAAVRTAIGAVGLTGDETIAGNKTFSGTVVLSALAAGSPWTGCVMWFAGVEANIPSCALLCYGQAVSRTTFAALFAKIGTTWGSGNGTTTFNLPDMRGRVPAGADDMGGSAANRLGSGDTGGITGAASLGASGGEQNHQLIVAEMPAHTHPVAAVASGANFNQGGGGLPNYDISGNTGSTGGGGSHNNVQPTIVGNWIIFT